MPSAFLVDHAADGFVARRLFYPSAGGDTGTPIRVFLPWIDEFWFVDKAYDLTSPFAKTRPLVDDSTEVLTGTTIRSGERFEVTVRRERYRWEGKLVTVHRCRGRGYDTFRTAFAIPGKTLSVFFHRGDSQGEGGSNFYWLDRQRLVNVVRCLEPGGLIVSDGSNAMSEFSPLGSRPAVAPDAAHLPPPFEAASRKFFCVGYLGRRYGPTLVWKVVQP